MRGRKRAEDATIHFRKNGQVVVSIPGKKKIISRRTHAIGSTAWFMMHILGLTAYDGEKFLVCVERMKESRVDLDTLDAMSHQEMSSYVQHIGLKLATRNMSTKALRTYLRPIIERRSKP